MSTLVAIPCMDMVHTEFFQSVLRMQVPGRMFFGISRSSLIYDARNDLARRAVEEGHERILWLDSDMVFDPGLAARLSEDLEDGREFVSGLYFRRKNPVEPVIYKTVGFRQHSETEMMPYAEVYRDYPEDAVFEIEGSGFGGVLMKTDLVKRVAESFGLPFTPQPGFGEDLSFCLRAKALGVRLYCDSRVKMGHLAQTVVTEGTYQKGVGI